MAGAVNLANASFAHAHADIDFDASRAVFEALDALRVAITVFDPAEHLVFANSHFNYLFASMPERESLVGISYEQLIRREIAGHEIAQNEGFDADAFVARRRAQFRHGEYRPLDITLSDGRVVEIKARRTPKGGWIALWSDVTSARHTLARLEDAIELSADAYAFFDRHDRLVMCNHVYAELHGASTPDEMRGRIFNDIVVATARSGLFAIEGDVDHWIERRLHAHNSPAGALTVLAANGTAYLVRERASHDGGRTTIFTDITDSRRTEIALGEQTRALERARRALAKTAAEAHRQTSYLADLTRRLDAAEAAAAPAKTTLLRTMSHELKTPLNAIIGFADLLRSTPDRFEPEQIEEYAGLIHAGGHNLLRLINQILDLTKIAAGRFELKHEKLDAGAAAWQAKELFEGKAAEKRVRIDAAACEALHTQADESALMTMIHNLVENAVSFTHDGGHIRLSVNGDDKRVRVTVSDNGPGVAPENMARILEPFEQAGRGTTDHSHGAGLGLTVVKALAELHGGTLILESEVGKGFSATLDLPAAK
ncbi:MAG TPA: PAS-domain containing protein [Rhizomicrobium sp.]|nr:PAS-domain containing protein [Rhizomicrobium sp.]